MTFTKLPKAITAEELLSTPLPPVKWIIPSLLPAGLALFAGPSKAGKSWLTLWLCLQVAQGKPVWGREIEPRTVLYLSLEDTFTPARPLVPACGQRGYPGAANPANRMSGHWARLGGTDYQLSLQPFRYRLVVIDTLQKFVPATKVAVCTPVTTRTLVR